MAISITGGPRPENIEEYSSVEDATPLDPSSGDGGYGQISWTSEDWQLARRLKSRNITLSDHERGTNIGIVRGVSGNNFVAQLTADSELGKFNVMRSAKPFSGLISELIDYWVALAGIYVEVDYLAPDRVVHVPGFYGMVWDHIKDFLSAHQLEMALVADRLVIRPPRMFVATNDFRVQHDYSAETQTSSIVVEVNYFNNKKITKGEVYPIPEGNDPEEDTEPSVQSVEAGETIEYDIELNASLSKVYQPVASEDVGPKNRSGSNGVYTIVGQDNLAIKPKQWLDFGGKVEVELTQDPSIITVRVTGADIAHLGPFRIAESAGGTDFNSLHITGDGVSWMKDKFVMYTGADPLETASEIGVTVENPYLSTKSQAWNAGQHTAGAHSGSMVSISGAATTINRDTMSRERVSATLGDVDYVHGQKGIHTEPRFNQEYVDEYLQEFDEHWYSMFREEFVNQVYGNISGARVYADYAFYRIENATITADLINYTGKMDTIIQDFNQVWIGNTIAEFNDQFDDENLDDFSMMPLWSGKEKVVGDEPSGVDTLHVFLGVGQSNMSGRGKPIDAPTGPRIMQYGALNGELRQAPVLLEMVDYPFGNQGTSPITFFADNYIADQPDNVGVLIIPAAKGGTEFAGTPSNKAPAYTWVKGAGKDIEHSLYERSIIQTQAAIAAAQAAGYTVHLKGILWHQGEGSAWMGTAGYAAALDNLIGDYRSELGYANLPFVVGQQCPEGMDVSPPKYLIDAAHQDTPDRVPYTGFAAATTDGHNPGDTTHFSTVGTKHLGGTYLEGYNQARNNIR